MKLVMTLLVRDEADILESQLSFHLNAGVDFVIVTDHESADETPAILERFEREGAIRVIRESGDYRRRDWITRMARLAASEHAADWVINSDADEFWWPRGGSLKAVLEAIPRRYGIVRTFVRHFPPLAADGEAGPLERMLYRLSPQAPINDPTSHWRPFRKVVHRADPQVVVVEGSHSLLGTSLRPLRGWYPIEVLHFPVRSAAQLERKGLLRASAVAKYYGGVRTLAGPGTAYHALAYKAAEENRIDELFASLAIAPDELEHGLASGVLQLDTRLRDALRAVATGEPIPFAAPTVVEDAQFALDAAVLGEADVVRARRQMDGIEERLRRLEANPAIRLERGLRSLLRRARGR
jgi:hypothetical protein